MYPIIIVNVLWVNTRDPNSRMVKNGPPPQPRLIEARAIFEGCSQDKMIDKRPDDLVPVFTFAEQLIHERYQAVIGSFICPCRLACHEGSAHFLPCEMSQSIAISQSHRQRIIKIVDAAYDVISNLHEVGRDS
ncbi:hypothetical protein [Rhodobacter sp. 24-YEA-8]|uniref:hypothetical protein n=1 Tax=Rhodobacter sp. 24-YEA-8 TaxID=1884310 RepID=UPI0008942952|nr:hypothetical protein [Rhodobacter sp. 24-YEA-8]SED17822.1 hypothetical protein SAMN05519105_3539 [Rhodobacter sp. 24-YEA-8]